MHPGPKFYVEFDGDLHLTNKIHKIRNWKIFTFSTHFLNKTPGSEAGPTFISKGRIPLKSENFPGEPKKIF